MKNRMIVFGIVFLFVILTFSSVKLPICYGSENEEVSLQIITEEFAPYNFRSEDGEITGRSTEVVKEILSRLSLDIEIQLMTWNKAYAMALSKPDVILYSTFRTDERENLFQWVGPIALDEMLFYALQGSDIVIDSLEDVKAVAAIGVVKDDARHQLLVQNNATNLKLYPTDVECYRALATGEVELVLGSNKSVASMAGQAGVYLSELKPVYSVRKNPIYIAFNKNISPNIVEEWQNTLNEIKRDGTFDTINERWGGAAVQGYTKSDTSVGINAIAATQLLAGYVDLRIGEFLAVLQALSFTDEARCGKWGKMKPLLVERENAEQAGRIWYLLPDGSYYTTVDDLTSKNLKSRSYFPGLIAGNPVLGSVVVSKSTGKPVAVVAAPIIKNDKVEGALGTSIYMQNINDEVRNTFPLQSNQVFFAMANDGIIALHSDDEWIGQQIGNISSELKVNLDKNSGECNFTFEGKDWHAVWTTAPKTGWRVLIANIIN
ncbi:MAG: transporter substrate-binding domain-containing protein [Candidatus Celaenobacter antarcticus]|nr:transporter substrate-binding domain-containing protein [Candidatus Celaenobacter antarcticus]